MRQPNETEFAEGLARIGLSVQHKPTGRPGVYFDAVGHQTTAEEWREFCRRSWKPGAGCGSRRCARSSTLCGSSAASRRSRPRPPGPMSASLRRGTTRPRGAQAGNTGRSGKRAERPLLRRSWPPAERRVLHHLEEAKRRDRFLAAYAEAVRTIPARSCYPRARRRRRFQVQPRAIPTSAARRPEPCWPRSRGWRRDGPNPRRRRSGRTRGTAAAAPSPEYVAAGYFVVVDGQTMVTPKGLEWLRSILPLIDAGPDPCHPERPA